jgi:hypothetical protein
MAVFPIYCSADSSFAEGSSQVVSFYQEESFDGTFVIDLGEALDLKCPLVEDDITDPKDLRLDKSSAEHDEENEGTDEEIESTNQEDEDADEYDDPYD